MPKEKRIPGKKGNSKPTIEIAKAQMTLTGFEYDKKILSKKARLQQNAILGRKPDHPVEVFSKSASRKSSLKPSERRPVSDEDVDCSDEQRESDIEEPPMNEDIELSDQDQRDPNDDSYAPMQTNKFE